MFERLLHKFAVMIAMELRPFVKTWVEQAALAGPLYQNEVIPVTPPSPLVEKYKAAQEVQVTLPLLTHSCGHQHHAYFYSFRTHKTECIECYHKRTK
jgi:hypothetical protein